MYRRSLKAVAFVAGVVTIAWLWSVPANAVPAKYLVRSLLTLAVVVPAMVVGLGMAVAAYVRPSRLLVRTYLVALAVVLTGVLSLWRSGWFRHAAETHYDFLYALAPWLALGTLAMSAAGIAIALRRGRDDEMLR